MAKASKRIVRRAWTTQDEKELKKHSKSKTSERFPGGCGARQVLSDKRHVNSDSQLAINLEGELDGAK